MAGNPACALDSCKNDGDVIATATLVFPAGTVFLPYRLCEEHADLLERFFIELKYPDGRVVKRAQSDLNT